MGLFEPKWLIRLASRFKIALSGSLWACTWFCHNCITASFSAFFFWYKCIITSIPLSIGCEFRGFLIWCLLWSAALHFQDVLPSRPVPVIRVPNRNVTSYPLNQSHSASRWLIQQCPDSKWMGSTFEACLWRRTCNPSQWVWKNKPRGLHVGDKQHMWDKHNQSWRSLASKSPVLLWDSGSLCVPVNRILTT